MKCELFNFYILGVIIGLVAIVVLTLALVFLALKIFRKWNSKPEEIILEPAGKKHTTFLKNDDLPQKLRWKIINFR